MRLTARNLIQDATKPESLTQRGIRAAEMVISGAKPKEVAQALNIGLGTIDRALVILRHGTAQQISDVRSERVSLGSMAIEIWDHRRGNSAPRRPAASREQATDRDQAKLINAEIWKNTRIVLDGLGNLPHPADVARIAKPQARKMGISLETKAVNAIAWLQQFLAELNE